VEFKRGVVQQLLKGEKNLTEVSRELDIQPSVVRQWKRRFEAGATAAGATNEDVVPVSALREAHQRIRELKRVLGKKQMEIEILQARRRSKKESVVAPELQHAAACDLSVVFSEAAHHVTVILKHLRPRLRCPAAHFASLSPIRKSKPSPRNGSRQNTQNTCTAIKS
jgi:transposase